MIVCKETAGTVNVFIEGSGYNSGLAQEEIKKVLFKIYEKNFFYAVKFSTDPVDLEKCM